MSTSNRERVLRGTHRSGTMDVFCVWTPGLRFEACVPAGSRQQEVTKYPEYKCVCVWFAHKKKTAQECSVWWFDKKPHMYNYLSYLNLSDSKNLSEPPPEWRETTRNLWKETPSGSKQTLVSVFDGFVVCFQHCVHIRSCAVCLLDWQWMWKVVGVIIKTKTS